MEQYSRVFPLVWALAAGAERCDTQCGDIIDHIWECEVWQAVTCQHGCC